jgi:hypothetical protein
MAMQAWLDKLRLASLADQRPHNGWSTPRIVESSGILYSLLAEKN